MRIETNVNKPRAIDVVQSAGIGRIASLAPQTIATALPKAPRLGCVNIHSCGLAGVWQISNGGSRSATIFHTVEWESHAGEALWKEHLPTLDRLLDGTRAKSAEALWYVLETPAPGDKLPMIREMIGKGAS